MRTFDGRRPSSKFLRRGVLLAVNTGLCLVSACAPLVVGQFPPSQPQLEEANAAAGDPYAGRFPYDEAVQGLPEGQPVARIVTEQGVIRCELAFDTAPLAVANFIGLVRGVRPFLDPASETWVTEPYYRNMSFHRALPQQFIQTGLRAQSEGGEASIGFRLQDERSIGDAFDRAGVMALANDGGANSSAAQFFITTQELRALDGKYSIIGRCDNQPGVRELERRILSGDGELPRIETIEIEMVGAS